MVGITVQRDMPSAPPSRGPVWAALGIGLCLLVITGGLVYAAATGTLLGAWTFWAAIGAAIVALFGLLSFVAIRGEQEGRVELSEPTFVLAFLASPDPMIITRAGVPVEANRAYIDLARRVGVMGESGAVPAVDRLFAGSASDDAASALYRLLGAGAGVGTETLRVLDEEGEMRTFSVDVTALGPETDFARLWRVRDLTGPEPMARTLADAPVGLATLDRGGRVVALNSTLSRWLDLAPGRAPAHVSEFLLDADALLDAPRDPARTVRLDTRLVTERGLETPMVATAHWRELEDGASVAALALYGHSNIASRGPAPALAASAHPIGGDPEAGDTFMSAPFAILQLNSRDLSSATVARANPAFGALTGRAATEGDTRLRFADIFTGEAPEFLSRNGDECEPDTAFEAEVAGPNGEQVHANVYIVCQAGPGGACWAYIVDVSQKRSLQDQLVQSQKMQAIGQLAAGVAHDFNNLLTAIRLNTDELLNRHPVGDPSYMELQRVNANVMRAAALVKKLLAFSRKQTLRTEVIDVTDALSDVSVTLRQTLSERVGLDIVHGRNLPPIRVDKSQLETVLINLCVNARDAMEGGGTITLSSEAVDAGELPLKNAYDDRAVLVTVADTGTGMPAEVVAKIFEPFFTTKEQGKGTGLGLATVYGIVQQSGGHLEVDSVEGRGTTFRIYLPATDPAVVEVVTQTPPEARAPSNLSGQGTILFVEDEESVRTIAAKTLRKRGYTVVEAGDGEEAFEWLEERVESGEGAPDLLISDVVMPGMDGPTLLKKGRGMLGEARIVFISGYAREEFSDLLEEEPDVTFLPKPFSLAQLAEKVKAEIGLAG